MVANDITATIIASNCALEVRLKRYRPLAMTGSREPHHVASAVDPSFDLLLHAVEQGSHR